MLSRKQIWRKTKKPSDIYDYNHLLNEKKIIKKNVSFNSMVSVILIPSIEDYRNKNLIKELWYSFEDYYKFYKGD